MAIPVSETIGCMFIHEKSRSCRFKAYTNLKCQFEHNAVEAPSHEENIDSDIEHPVDVTTLEEEAIECME